MTNSSSFGVRIVRAPKRSHVDVVPMLAVAGARLPLIWNVSALRRWVMMGIDAACRRFRRLRFASR